MDREANMSMSYLRRSRARDRIATCTVTTYHIKLVGVAIRSKETLASVKPFIFPYEFRVWVCVLMCFLLMLISNRIGRNIRSINNLQIFEIFMGVTTLYQPQGRRHTLQFLTWLWCTFVLRSMYQAMIFYLYNIELYREPPKSIEGLAKEGYSIICNNMSLQFLENIPLIADKNISLIVLDALSEIEQLEYLDQQGNDLYAAVVAEDIAHYFVAHHKTEHILEVLPFNINSVQTAIFLPKHSYLVGPFDDNILRFLASGLPRAWLSFSGETRYGPHKKQKDVGNRSHMSMAQITAVWKINALILFIALGVFALELLSIKIKCIQKLFK